MDACDNWMTESYKGSMELYVECPGDENVTFKDGHSFMDIIDMLMRMIPEGSIQTQKKATKIIWSKNGAKVEVNNGEYVVDADYVIFTGSMGYLKENHKSLFEPR